MMSRLSQSNYWLLMYAAGKRVTVFGCARVNSSKLMVTRMALVKLVNHKIKQKGGNVRKGPETEVRVELWQGGSNLRDKIHVKLIRLRE